MRTALPATLLLPALLHAQVDLPVFGTQQVINGYAKDVEGEVLSYFSVYPEHATTALLTRCTDGKKAIAWETAVVPNYPHEEEIGFYYFSWIAAHNSTTSGGDRSFDLHINDQFALSFTTRHSTKPGSWSAAAADSTKLVFEFSKKDRHGDAHGFAHLRVPRKYITPGQPLRLKVVGHAQNSPDWFMTFRYSFEEKVEVEALPFLTKRGKQEIQVSLMTNAAVGDMYMVKVHGQTTSYQEVLGRLTVATFPVDPVTETTELRVEVGVNDRPTVVREITIEPVTHRDIHLIHHSHTD
ncbi:MAG TPA: glycoside hydrolase, partial [Flavobacteriales bacterium]|nr:glycoside hydrolase [Flavobacteriales bacterium]